MKEIKIGDTLTILGKHCVVYNFTTYCPDDPSKYPIQYRYKLMYLNRNGEFDFLIVEGEERLKAISKPSSLKL